MTIGVAAGFWCAVVAAIAWRLNGLAADDFFITYRYAQNLGLGHGFVFNPGERVFGLTEPGLGLLLAGLHALTRLEIPALGTATTALALAGIAVLMLAESAGLRGLQGFGGLWGRQGRGSLEGRGDREDFRGFRDRVGREDRGGFEDRVGGGRRIEALVGGTLVVTSSYLWVNQGAAVPLVLLLLLAAARLAERRPAVAGLLAGAAVWMRPDALAGAGLLGLLLWGERKRFPWRYAMTAGAVVVAGAVLARGYFGVWLPNTLAAKHAMGIGVAGTWAGPLRFWQRAVPLLARHWGPAWWLVIAVGLIGQWPLFRSMGRGARLLVLFAAFLDVAYPCLSMPFFSWYTVPFAVVILYGAAFAVLATGRLAAAWLRRAAEGGSPSPAGELAVGGSPGDTGGSAGDAGGELPLRRRGGPALRAARLASGPGPALAANTAAAAADVAVAALLLALLLPLLLADRRWFAVFNWQPQLETYRKAAVVLAQISAPEDEVAYVEIGVLAYYSQRPVVDLLGLVTPGSIPYVERDDLVGAFLAHPTRFVIYHTRGRMGPLLARPWFGRAYQQVARIEQGGGQWLAIFRRRPGAPLPPPRPPQASPAAGDAPRPD